MVGMMRRAKTCANCWMRARTYSCARVRVRVRCVGVWGREQTPGTQSGGQGVGSRRGGGGSAAKGGGQQQQGGRASERGATPAPPARALREVRPPPAAPPAPCPPPARLWLGRAAHQRAPPTHLERPDWRGAQLGRHPHAVGGVNLLHARPSVARASAPRRRQAGRSGHAPPSRPPDSAPAHVRVQGGCTGLRGCSQGRVGRGAQRKRRGGRARPRFLSAAGPLPASWAGGRQGGLAGSGALPRCVRAREGWVGGAHPLGGWAG